jgi:hypothetical protein
MIPNQPDHDDDGMGDFSLNISGDHGVGPWAPPPPAVEAVRHFDTGATRSSDAGRYDPEGFLSPIVIERYCDYMQKHRLQPDGSMRDSDNWQKGIPKATYMKGLWRHVLHLWTRFRGFKVQDSNATANMEEDLCSVIFNAQGMLFEMLKDQRR